MGFWKGLIYTKIIAASILAGIYFTHHPSKTNVLKYIETHPQDRKEIFLRTRNYIKTQTPELLDSLRLSEITKEDFYNFGKKEIDYKINKLKQKKEHLKKSLLDRIENAIDELRK